MASPFNYIFVICLFVIMAMLISLLCCVAAPFVTKLSVAFLRAGLRGLGKFGEKMIRRGNERAFFVPVIAFLGASIFLLFLSRFDTVVDIVIVVVGCLAFVVGLNQTMPDGGGKVPRTTRNLAFVVSMFIASATVSYIIYCLSTIFQTDSSFGPLKEWLSEIDKGNLQTIVLSLYSFGLLLFTALQVRNVKGGSVEERQG